MQFVAKENDLDFGSDVKMLIHGNSNALMNYFKTHQNQTKYGVLFCIDNLDFMNVSIPCSFEYYKETLHLYTIVYNMTNIPNGYLSSGGLPIPKDPALAKLKQDIDNGYLNYYASKNTSNTHKPPKINATLQSFPSIPNRFLENASIISSTGAFYFFFPPMISFVVVLLEIIREKDLKLRKVKIHSKYRVFS